MICVIKQRNTIFMQFIKHSAKANAFSQNSFKTMTERAFSSLTDVEHFYYLSKTQEFIPKLNSNLHKGECGKIGVIGGSFEYTGAPYFAAISALKLGADLVHVFCSSAAGPTIKSYSPELIVHPFLDSQDACKRIEPWLERLHVLVIGPGLGRDPDLLENVGQIIKHCSLMLSPLPLILDADGLFLITEKLDLIQNYNGPLILTPNNAEFTRLSSKLGETDPLKIATSLKTVLLQKGFRDIITNGMISQKYHLSQNEPTVVCDWPGSNRRCGGQGDILSGCIATFVAWLQIYIKSNRSSFSEDETDYLNDPLMEYSWALYCACVITRTCSRLAYEDFGRSMTASDMIPYIHKAFTLLFSI